jgi:hypothetical protein
MNLRRLISSNSDRLLVSIDKGIEKDKFLTKTIPIQSQKISSLAQNTTQFLPKLRMSIQSIHKINFKIF